ncbi:MAG: hypothetical protein E7199_02010 [Schwartzia succinivorans]|nr:hypothetical protein [Schwartzia succinivorans]
MKAKLFLIPAAISVFCVAASCAEACTTTIEGRVLADWRELHGRLLSVNDGDRRIDYDGAHRPAADKVEKY